MGELNRVEFLSQLMGTFGGKTNFRKKNSHNAEKLKGGNFFLLRFFNFWKKTSQYQKVKRATSWYFSKSILSQNIEKMKGNRLGKNISEKQVSQGRKNEREDLLVSPGMVCYTGRQEEIFLV